MWAASIAGPGGGDPDNEDVQDGGDGGPGSQQTQRRKFIVPNRR